MKLLAGDRTNDVDRSVENSTRGPVPSVPAGMDVVPQIPSLGYQPIMAPSYARKPSGCGALVVSKLGKPDSASVFVAVPDAPSTHVWPNTTIVSYSRMDVS